MADNMQVIHEHEDRMTLSIGPHHPATHGVLRVVLELEGEIIKKGEPENGFLHTGIEKTAENLNWQQASVVIDRMDYLNPIGNQLGYVLAVEKALGITDQIPDRATVARVILAELQRIASHMVFLGTGALDVGAMSPYFWCFDIREHILEIFEHTCGARMNPSYLRIGGLSVDLPANFKELVEAFLKWAPEKIKDVQDVVLMNPIFIDRTKGIGALDMKTALSYGLTGHNLRVCGSDYDVRKYYPYCGYEKYDFKVPVYQNGDMWDRTAMRFDECYESLKIIRQALDNLPDGPFKVQDRKIALPPKAEVRENMEALIHHFKLVQHGIDVPAGETYHAVESPRGELGFYIVSDGGPRPLRVRVRPPSYYAVHALAAMLPNHFVADMVIMIAGIDPVFGEVDR